MNLVTRMNYVLGLGNSIIVSPPDGVNSIPFINKGCQCKC